VKNIHVLLVHGGHDFDHEAFFEMFRNFEGITFEEKEHPQAAAWFAPEKITRFDALIFYDFGQTIPADSKQHLLAAFKRGTGAVFMHHTVHNHADWPEYPRIVGGFWNASVFTIDGKNYGPSTSHPGLQIPVRVVDRTHPITNGMDDWQILDETYGNYYIGPGVNPLLVTDHPKSERILAWTHTYQKARIAYIQSGHDRFAFENPSYRQVVRQAITWTARTPLST